VDHQAVPSKALYFEAEAVAMRQRVIFLSLSMVTVLIIAQKAKAQIYTYTDQRGVVHFTNVPTDNRFRLYRRDSMRPPDDPYRYQRYEDLIKWAARKYGVDAALIKAIIRVESDFYPWAISHKGAKGLMQLMPDTAMLLLVNNPFDPRENIDAGVRFYRHLLGQLNGDIVLALAAYNAGLEAVRKYNGVPPFQETAHYVRKVLHFFRGYRQP
jgi:soluble lytic murein transglycosylase-like protein